MYIERSALADAACVYHSIDCTASQGYERKISTIECNYSYKRTYFSLFRSINKTNKINSKTV